MKRVAQEHVAELDTKILELTAMRDTLQKLADACYGDHRPDGPILHDLEGGTGTAEVTKHATSRKSSKAGDVVPCYRA